MARLGDNIDRARAEEQDKDVRWLKLEEIARELHEEGHDFTIVNGEVVPGVAPHDYRATVSLPNRADNKRLRIGLVSDPHLGSNFEQLSALRDFYDYCEEREVDLYLNAGDIVQGTPKMHRGMEHEVHLHSASGQIGYAGEVYPRPRRAGVKTYMISGNHDDSWLNESGTNVVRLLAQRRDDIEYIGQDSCYFEVDGLRTYIVHPAGGVSYAKSYKPQKLSEAIPYDQRTQLVLVGHYHSWGQFEHQRAQVFMLPCFQGSYPYLIRLALRPAIGGVYVEVEYDDEVITDMSVTRRWYPEVKHDWDEEVSRKWRHPGDVLPE